MRILLTVLSTTFLATAALAQQQPTVTPPVAPEGTVQATAAIAECDRLKSYLEGTPRPAGGVTVEQVAAWRQSNDFEACRTTLQRLTQANKDSSSTQPNQTGSTGATGSPTATSGGLPAPAPSAPPPPPPQATALPAPGPSAPQQAQAQPGPASPGGTSAPQVLVQQAHPSVTVRQRQPEIIVRQAPPVITVQLPQPEIIVRMPEPDVNVSVARPEVQVNMPQPVVQVVPPQVRSDGRQPNVRFERSGEPRIVYQPAEGQPQIRFENAGETPQNAAGAEPRTTPPVGVSPQAAQAQLNAGRPGDAAANPAPVRAEPVQTGALPPAAGQAVMVSQLEDMEVYNGRGEKLGEVEKVVTGTDNVTYVLINHGGFLGLGTRLVAISSDQIALQGNRLVAENLTDEQLQAFPEFKETAQFKELEGEQTASIRAHR